MKLYRAVLWLFTALLAVVAFPTQARCSTAGTSVLIATDNNSAFIPFGTVNLYDTYFSPVGSLLGSVTVPPTNYTYNGATASTVLWTCDATDLSSIYFMVATNGDDRVGGYYDLGATDGIKDVYATYFAYVGIKQTMSGVVLTRYWQKVPVTTYATSGSKIQIRLQDIPALQAELYRISTLPGTNARSAYCGNNNTANSGIVYGTASGAVYSCNQPNSYIQLVGTGLSYDTLGSDSATNYKFFYGNAIAYGMRTVNRLYNTPTCVVRNATPLVVLPTITASALNSGSTSTANFTVSVECSNSVTSGTATSQTAMGFQVSPGAYSAASTLGLVNSSNGVSMLLSDNYTGTSAAKGVGITIAYSNTPSTPLTLIGQTIDPLNTSYMGNSGGWYAVLSNATSAGSSQSGYTNYTYNFIATLKSIPGQTATAGSVSATATVLVKVQ